MLCVVKVIQTACSFPLGTLTCPNNLVWDRVTQGPRSLVTYNKRWRLSCVIQMARSRLRPNLLSRQEYSPERAHCTSSTHCCGHFLWCRLLHEDSQAYAVIRVTGIPSLGVHFACVKYGASVLHIVFVHPINTIPLLPCIHCRKLRDRDESKEHAPNPPAKEVYKQMDLFV